MLMKLLSPTGLIIIAILLAIIFLPRRLPDTAKKIRKPMRAFPDEPVEPAETKGKQPDEPRRPE